MYRRPRAVLKLDLFARAKRLVARGMPPTFIAERLGISRQTLLNWVQLMDHDHAFTTLRRRVLQLPEQLRERLVTDLVDARSAA